MDDAIRGRRGLPLSLVIGLALAALSAVVFRYVYLASELPRAWMFTIEFSADVTSGVLCAVGTSELAQRNTGAARLGLRLASLGWWVMAAVDLSWRVFVALESVALWNETWRAVCSYTSTAGAWLPAVGLVVATRRRNRALAIVGLAFTMVGHVPRFAWGWGGLGRVGAAVLHGGSVIIALAWFAGLAASLAREPAGAESDRAAAGLDRSAAALRLLVVAGFLGTSVLLVEIAHPYGYAASAVQKLGSVSGAAITMAALFLLARGLLGAARGESSRGALVAAATIALWCGAIACVITFQLYGAFYGDGSGYRMTELEALSRFWLPLVTAAGLGLVTLATDALATPRATAEPPQDEIATPGIARFGERFERERANRQGSDRRIWIIFLLFASPAISYWLSTDRSSIGSQGLAVIIAFGCSAAAWLLLASLCRRAAAVIARDRRIPEARVVVGS
jgi:hypothetical protein